MVCVLGSGRGFGVSFWVSSGLVSFVESGRLAGEFVRLGEYGRTVEESLQTGESGHGNRVEEFGVEVSFVALVFRIVIELGAEEYVVECFGTNRE
jgi:hypothetical protein